jgi:hypothetical protein
VKSTLIVQHQNQQAKTPNGTQLLYVSAIVGLSGAYLFNPSFHSSVAANLFSYSSLISTSLTTLRDNITPSIVLLQQLNTIFSVKLFNIFLTI